MTRIGPFCGAMNFKLDEQAKSKIATLVCCLLAVAGGSYLLYRGTFPSNLRCIVAGTLLVAPGTLLGFLLLTRPPLKVKKEL